VAKIYHVGGAADSLRILPHDIVRHGERTSPRGQDTYELRNVTIVLEDPTDCMAVGVGRKMNIKLAVAEALQLVGGFSDPEVMGNIAPNVRQFRTGGIFSGAYGPRIRPQIEKALRRLQIDPDTRQAVVTVWDPLHDQQDGIKDIPCTISMNWHIRDGKLHQTTHMRSNDIWWGWTYDVVQFTQLQCTMANLLEVPIGQYVHMVDSLHLYERNIDDMMSIMPQEGPRPRLSGLGMDQRGFVGVRDIAEQLFYDTLQNDIEYTETERAMHGILHG
jgi:thymidylate synthase